MAAPTPIDRDKTTPSLLRVFYRMDGHNSEMAFGRDVFPSNELHFYTWPDATLKELSELLKDVVGPARKRVARLEFALVYPNKEGRYRLRQLGIVRNSARGPDDAKTLKELNYQIGDYLDIAVMIGNEGPRGRGGPGEFGGRRDGEFGGRRDGEFGGRRDGDFGGRRDGEFGGRRDGGPQGGYGGGPTGARGGEERGNTRDNAGYGSFGGAQRGRGNYSER